MYLNLLLVVIFFCCVAFMLQGGLWGNTLMLINVVTAGLLAMNYFEPIAGWLEGMLGNSYTYLMDFLGLWMVFVLAMIVLRTLTDKLSQVKVKFRKPVDQAGGILIAVWIGWVMVGFTLTTLHTAPLARNFLDGAFQPDPDSRMFFGLGPDRAWLGFTQKSSTGAFSYGAADAHKFDPFSEYILKYSERRFRFEAEPETRVRPR